MAASGAGLQGNFLIQGGDREKQGRVRLVGGGGKNTWEKGRKGFLRAGG